MRYLSLAILFISCGSPKTDFRAISMNDSIQSELTSESMILPYRDSLDLTMNSVLVMNETELTRGLPESTLGNLVADLLLERAQLELPSNIQPDMCLINIGGLRVDLPAGDVTVGKVFELMPFENELEVLRLSKENMLRMVEYLKEKGGQPIAGIRLKITSTEDQGFVIPEELLDSTRSYYVVTSDYLADGGDGMYFFKDPMERISTGIKIRDAIMDHFRIVELAGKPISAQLDGRLIIE